MKHDRPYLLTFSLLLSSLLFTLLGSYWNQTYYHNKEALSPSRPTLATAMQGIHDGLLMDLGDQAIHMLAASGGSVPVSQYKPSADHSYYADIQHKRSKEMNDMLVRQQQAAKDAAQEESKALTFTTATDDYFSDAVFIGDSRTVGISEFSGIKNATFLCKTSLSIYDFI